MSNTELDTMNELAEAENSPSDFDVIADMAPLHRNTPPPPPEPPPCRLSCSSCGYTAPEPEFHKKHPYCKVGIVIWAMFGFAILMMVGTIVAIILHGLGITI